MGEAVKVLYFHQHFVTPKGAGAIRSYAMARKLIERGHSVTLVCGSAQGGTTGLVGNFVNGQRRGVVDGIDVLELNLEYSNSDGFAKRVRTFLSFALRSVKVALTEQYDLVFATTTPLTAGIPGILARWLRSKPFVFEVRDLWPELPKAMGVVTNPVLLSAMSLLEWVSYRSAHSLIGLSPGIVEGIKKRGVPAERITMIPNGCDLDIFATEAEPWRPEEIADTDLMAIFAGTHGIANGLDAVLDAAAELKRRGISDIKLLLIGNGKLKPALQERARREGLDNVVFHDPVIKTRLAGLMQSTDLGMQILANVPAFYYGTSPNKFFDYISAGLPVLSNYPGWLAGMIENEQCGYVVPPADPKAFADALERAAANRGGLKVMSANSRTLAKREFDRRQLSDQWVVWVEDTFRKRGR
nr:glycosyltransferase family 4 protein [Pollutimonas harenae]